jgi:hypothetical protein
MAGSDTTLPPLRAVLLSRDPILGARALRLCANGWRAIRVDSGYEAAAEILSSPVAVLLIDLRSLGGLHRGLLALARRMEVQLAAIAGETPPDMTADDLQGLRRIEVGDIPAALAGARESLAGRVANADESAGPASVSEAPRASAAPDPALAPAQAEAPPAQPMRVMLTPRSGKPKALTGLLTPEELAFLLEDER